MKSQLACVLRITDVTNCDVINIRNIIYYWIREIKRSPDTTKAAAILVKIGIAIIVILYVHQCALMFINVH